MTAGKIYDVISISGWSSICVENDICAQVDLYAEFWDIEELEPVNIDKLIKVFETKLSNNFGLKLSDNDKTTIINKLENHKDCMKNGKVNVVLYNHYGWNQSRKLSLECINCNEAIFDIYEKEI